MTKTIDEALFALQGLLRGVKKDSKNPHFKNNYASLEQVTDTIRPHMQALGLYWIQMPGKIVDGAIEVTTRITHAESGEKIEFTMEMPLAKRDPQGAGSSLTYAMRYSLMAALGLPPTDDDAETAIDRNNERETPANQSPPNQKETPKDEEARKLYTSLVNDMRKCTDADSLAFWWKDQECVELRKKLPDSWQANLREEWVTLGKELRALPQAADRFPGDDIANHPLNAG